MENCVWSVFYFFVQGITLKTLMDILQFRKLMVENWIDLPEADSSNYFTIRIDSRAISILFA